MWVPDIDNEEDKDDAEKDDDEGNIDCCTILFRYY